MYRQDSCFPGVIEPQWGYLNMPTLSSLARALRFFHPSVEHHSTSIPPIVLPDIEEPPSVFQVKLKLKRAALSRVVSVTHGIGGEK